VTTEAHHKVRSGHLKREAYLYVRQSTLRQVLENTESRERQYALKDRAIALGWPRERIVVIDSDLGQSAASAADRAGFQRLVADVGLGRVGIVLGLEVSRLARSSVDWQRLLEICSLSDTLILDEDGIYDPGHFNDRLLLGLKGTMSEAELHLLRARLRGGILSKARRGELKTPLPVGFIYDAQNQVRLDPDQQVQQTLHLFFATFRRTGSATATVRTFREQGLLFPIRARCGPGQGELHWRPLVHHLVLRVLKNPRYAGVFCFGRTQSRKTTTGNYTVERLPRDQWLAMFPDAHPGYISLAEYEENVQRLRENALAHGSDRRRSPPREGPALLQGLAICGICGLRMTVRYHSARGTLIPEYMCQREGIEHARPFCQHINGGALDEAIGDLLVETVTPLALEVTLAIQEELQRQAEEVDRLRQQQVERARYEAELAQRRYMRVDPDNRLVADALEAEWNHKLRTLAEAQDYYQQQRDRDHLILDEQARAEIAALAVDFPRLWRDPRTSFRERKRMARLILEDVTLIKKEQVTAHLRFKGGTTRSLTLPLPLPLCQQRKTARQVVEEVDRLLDHHTDQEVAELLNTQGLRSGTGQRFSRHIVRDIRLTYGLTDRFTRLRTAGLLTRAEMAERLGVSRSTINNWRYRGLLACQLANDKGEYLYEPPGANPPVKWKHKPVSIQTLARS
jgi:DNA invertase Pin-like site-specific DNA recombinase/DNA-binding transcriptional regulator YiaG